VRQAADGQQARGQVLVRVLGWASAAACLKALEGA